MSRSQKNKRRKVYRQMMATRMGFTRQTFEIDYFTSITIERGQQWIGVQWRTGMHTLQPVEQLREDLNPSTFRKMMSMATRDNATPEQSVVLATTREKWLKSQPGAVTRAQARLAPASTSTLPPITDNDCKDVEPPLLQRCTRCARVSPGEHVSPFVCWHCSDANAAPVDLVQRHGTPRPHDVVVWCGAGEPEFIDLVRVTVDSTGQCAPLVTSAGHDKKVDIVIVSYHEDNKTLSEHIALVNAAIAYTLPVHRARVELLAFTGRADRGTAAACYPAPNDHLRHVPRTQRVAAGLLECLTRLPDQHHRVSKSTALHLPVPAVRITRRLCIVRFLWPAGGPSLRPACSSIAHRSTDVQVCGVH